MVLPRRYPPTSFDRAAIVLAGLFLITSAIYSLRAIGNYDGSGRLRKSRADEEISRKTFVVTTTYYPDLADLRFNLALEMCKLAQLYKIHLVIVDDSPNHELVRKQFQQAGTAEYVRVYQQDKANYAGKGGALKQAIAEAANLIRDRNTEKGNGLLNAVICFTEPEKVDLFNHLHDVARPILEGKTDVVVPTRNDELFKETYPIEQYHSESFGNLHFDLLAKHFPGFQNEGAKKLDWLFGPFAFKASLAKTWLNYPGTSWGEYNCHGAVFILFTPQSHVH